MVKATGINVKNKTAVQKGMDVLFWFAYLYAFNFAFFFTTMYSLKSWVPEHLEDLRWGLILSYGITLAICVIKLFSEYGGWKERILPLFIIFAALGLSYDNNITNREIALFLLLVVASKGQSMKKIIAAGFVNGLIWLIVCFVGTRIGVIEDLVYKTNKHSFGIGYNTDLMSHILFLIICYCILRSLKLSIFDILGIFIINVLNVFMIKGKVAFVCVAATILLMIYFRYILPHMDSIRQKKIFSRLKSISVSLLVAAPLILAAVSFIFTLMYKNTDTPAVDSVFKHFHTLRARYLMGGQAFRDYKVTAWGQWVYELGNGGSTEPVAAGKYFALDISYIKIFFSFGLIPLIAYLSLMLTAAVRCVKYKRYDLLCLTAVIALDCAVEHHLYCVAYNVPLFMAMTDWDIDDGFEYKKLFKASRK